MRDEFSIKTKKCLAEHAGYRCSFRGCDQTANGSIEETKGANANVGEAWHIAAAPPGPSVSRHEPSRAAEQQNSVENGISMCRTHAKMIDADEETCTVELLIGWKEEAENRARLTRSIRENKFVQGEAHPDTATSLNNMGILLQSIGHLEAAKPYQEQALANMNKVLGGMHPDTATSLNNLGALLQSMGELEGAKSYFVEALAIRAKNLGQMHPDSAKSLDSLGTIYSQLGHPEDALALIKEAVMVYRELAKGNREAFLPSLAGSLNNLGNRYGELGRREDTLAVTEEAVVLYQIFYEAQSAPFLQNFLISARTLARILQEQDIPTRSDRVITSAVNLLANTVGERIQEGRTNNE